MQPSRLRRLAVIALVGALALALGVPGASAQTPPGRLRLAFLPQWAIQQHRGPSPALREAIENGVVDRTVFSWQRGVLQRQALVQKPIRLVPDVDGTLGGRGQFALAAVHPPRGRAAWTEVEVTHAGTGADDVLLLEIGGERNTLRQVLETLLVLDPAQGLVEVPLARAALIPGPGVPVVAVPFEQPLPPAMARRFHTVAGMDVLVARSPLWDTRNGGDSASGPADSVPLNGGDWREGDRVFLRIPAALLDRGVPGLVLGWKDRVLTPDPDTEFPRRSELPFPRHR